MFERFNTPEEVFSFKLGSALTMERKLVEVLEELEAYAQRDEVKRALREHREETGEHVTNVERCFQLLGEDINESPCGVVEALAKEGKSTIKKTDDSIVDTAVLAASVESEHHEIAVYETLIANAEARGASEIVDLLRRNLGQEEHALEVARNAMSSIATMGIAVSST